MVEESGYLSHLHYGGRIDDLAGAVALFQNSNPAFSPYPEDSCPEHSRNHIPQEYSTSAAGDFRLASASVRTPDGCATTDFKFAGYRIIPGKPELPGLPASYSTADAPAETLEITLRDAASKVEFVLAYSVFEKYDVIVAPAAPTTAPELGKSLSDPIKMYLGDIYTISVNLAGLPGITIPVGKDSKGLPVGMQLIGNCFEENKIIQTAYTFEQTKVYESPELAKEDR